MKNGSAATKIARLAVPLILGLLLVAGTLAGLARAADGAFRESVLPDATEPEEIYLGADGNVWISDYDAGTVWQVNPATFAFKRFNGLSGAVDARPGPGGYVWWLDSNDDWLGRLEISTGQVTTWTTDLNSIWGLAFDEQGRVWIGGYTSSLLMRFDPVSHQRCELSLPNSVRGYLVAHDGAIWYGVDNAGVGRLNTTSNVNTFWSFGSAGLGAWSVAVSDPSGVWFVDDNHALIGRVDIGLTTLTTYTSSLLDSESMVLARGQSIWFTDQAGLLVALDPAASTGVTTVIAATNTTITPDFCIDAGAGVTHTVSTSSGTLLFTAGTFTSTVENGMTHYGLPAGAYPYGLADVRSDLWFVDLDRETVTILEGQRLYLPLVLR